jgi:hypothetical protein
MLWIFYFKCNAKPSNKQTPWSRVLFQKLIVAQRIKKSPIFWETYWTNYEAHHYALFSMLPFLQIFSSASHSDTLNLCSFLRVRDLTSHPYKTTGKVSPYFCLLNFWIGDRKTKDSELNGRTMLCYNMFLREWLSNTRVVMVNKCH